MPALEADIHWKAELIHSTSGAPKALLANGLMALRLAPEWAGAIGFDEFRLLTCFLKEAPIGGRPFETWADHYDCLVADWLQRQGIHVGREVAGQAVQTVAREHCFHPVRLWLDRLVWDGEPRLDSWPVTYLGAEPSNYSAAAGARWLISAIARVMRPGIKADCVPVFEGPQGIGKSRTLRTLFEPWFSDELCELGTKMPACRRVVSGVLN